MKEVQYTRIYNERRTNRDKISLALIARLLVSKYLLLFRELRFAALLLFAT